MKKTISTKKKSKATRPVTSKASSCCIDNPGNPEQTNSETATARKTPALDPSAYTGWIGEFVHHACERSEVDKAAVLVTLLLRLCGYFYNSLIKYGEEQHHARINAVIVGDTPRSNLLASINIVDRLFGQRLNSYRYFTEPICRADEIIYRVRDATSETNDFSRKKTIIDAGETSKNLFVFDRHLALSLKSLPAKSEIISSMITGLFDTGNVSIQWAKDQWLKTTDAHVTILAHIQRGELVSLKEKLDIPNEFANRFLWILASRQKCIPIPTSLSDKVVAKYKKRTTECIEYANNISGFIQLSKNAQKFWNDVYPGLTREYKGFAGTVLSHNEVHALRLAQIYAISKKHAEIGKNDLKAAIAIVNYSSELVLQIFNGCEADKRKEKLLQAMRSAPDHELSLTQINDKVFKHNCESSVINSIISELELEKLVTVQTSNEKKVGRVPKIVRLVTE